MELIAATFDRVQARWESPAVRRSVATGLVGVFLLALIAIELGRRGLVPASLPPPPSSHFQAIELAFSLLLAYEVVGLVFGIARSVSNAAGKQLEIFSLILLRQAFEVLSNLEEPLRWAQLRLRVLEMLADGAGALAIFVVVGFYYRLQRHRPAPGDLHDRMTFIAAKKGIALLLLGTFATLGGQTVVSYLARAPQPHGFFEPFYTLLIFADVLIVLLSVRYSSTYEVVFRNSGLAVATVLLRMALSAPAFVKPALGIGSALLALALAAAYRAFAPTCVGEDGREASLRFAATPGTPSPVEHGTGGGDPLGRPAIEP